MKIGRRAFMHGTIALGTSLIAGRAQANLTKIKIGHTAGADYAPTWVAKDHGFFEKRGLDVEIVLMPLNSTIPAAMQAGSIQIGTPTPPVFIQAIVGGLDLTAVGAASFTSKDSKMFGLVARNGLEIKTPADLAGKKVGVPGIGALLHVLFREWLTRNNVNFESVNMPEVSLPQMGDLLRGASVDVAVASDPMMSRAVAAGNGYVYNYFTQDLPDVLATQYAAQRKWAQENRKLVDAFKAGLAEGVEKIASKPEEARNATEKYLKIDRSIVNIMNFPAFKAELTSKDFDFWVDVMKRQGMLNTSVDTGKLVYPA